MHNVAIGRKQRPTGELTRLVRRQVRQFPIFVGYRLYIGWPLAKLLKT